MDGPSSHRDKFYALFRIVIGLLFAQHGASTLFGVFGASASLFPSFSFLFGFVELLGGIMVALGLFAKTASFMVSLDVLRIHAGVMFSYGLLPTPNRGELSLIYLVSFLLIMVCGAGKYSLDSSLWRDS